jgi:heme-degrading monooxygenase HmoA
MIARIWRGWAPPATAGDYQHHYESEVTRHLQGVDGFCGARLLRQDDGLEIMFTSVTFFTSIDAVRDFAGEDYEQAVVEEAGRRVLSRWDESVSHHDVVVDLHELPGCQEQAVDPIRNREAPRCGPA